MTDSDLDFNIKISPDDENKPKEALNPQKNNKVPEPSNQKDLKNNANAQTGVSSAFDLSKASHPFLCIFSLSIKVAAILCFLLLNSLLDNSILTFIIVILLTAFDFYLTKNISGRFLVGLRWWNDFKDDGTEIWIFESYDSPQKKPSSVDAAFFWTSQIGSLAVWGLFVFVDVISFKIYWVLVSGTAMVLNGVNFWGFYKCRGEHQKKVKDWTNQGIKNLGQQIIANALNKV